MLTVAETTQNIWNFMVRKSSLQEIATLVIIQVKSDSNLETGRYSPKLGVSRVVQESWQQWKVHVPISAIDCHRNKKWCRK